MVTLNRRTERSGALFAALIFTATFAACADDEKPTKSSANAGCAHDVLEPDLDIPAPAGPGVDLVSGALKLESDEDYVVSSTYGVPVPGNDGAPVTERYLQLFSAVQRQLMDQPGLLSLQLGQSAVCGSGRTVAVWQSEEQMYAFVTSPAHLAAMSAVEDILQPGYAVTHWEARSAEDMTFEAAVRQLAQVDAR